MMKKLRTFLALALLVPLSAAAQVSFTSNVSQGCSPLTVTFTNTSVTGTNYGWSFGDGGPMWFGNDTSHTFTYPGDFNVMLTAYDNMWNPIGNYSTNITVNGVSNMINSTVDTACVNEMIGFDIWSPNTQINSYSWSFGDNTTSTQDHPQHAYASAGTYTVQVIVNTAQCGNDTVTKQIVVSNTAQPDAQFWFSSMTACPGDPIEFNPRNWNANTYHWNFGNGDTSVVDRPTYTYAATGTYVVSLTITNICGGTDTYSDTITIQNNLFVPNWTNVYAYPNFTVCPGDPITFESNVAFASYEWVFGDGDTSFAQMPTHVYNTAGTYTLSATLTNGCGNDTVITRTVTIGNNLPFTNAYMQVPDSACPGDNVLFWAGNASTWVWDFGDGDSSTVQNASHAYAAAGTYTVSLTMTNGCGNDTTISQSIVISSNIMPQLDPEMWGAATSSACPGDSMTFFAIGGSSYIWYFGDGDSTTVTTPFFVSELGATVDIANHEYAAVGTYTVTLVYFNACGNSDTATTTVTIGNAVPVNGELVSPGTNLPACEPVNFLALGGDIYDWDFGDGNTLFAAQGNVSHLYNNPGTYTVSVTVTNACGNSAVYSQVIDITGASALAVSAAGMDTICQNSSATISVTGNGTYSWSPAASLSCTTCASPVASPTVTTTYTVTVTNGVCVGMDSVTIYVDVCTGVEEAANAGMDIYPNPSQGIVNIGFKRDMSSAVVEVYSMDGKRAAVQHFSGIRAGAVNVIDVSSLPAGIYYLEVSYEGVTHHRKIVIAK